MDFKFKRKRLNEIPTEKLLDELEKVAKHFKYIEFAARDFDKMGGISATTVINRFGGWKESLNALKKHLQKKGLNFSPRPYDPRRILSDKELFDEMERIWKKVGQRPSETEWKMSNPKISYSCYMRRFGGWINACKKFIEYKMGEEILEDEVFSGENEDIKTQQKNKTSQGKSTRNISLALRIKVLNRDNFRCVFCGKSPATDIGVKLEIDHIKPFSKDGKSTLENLQTLCHQCNLGKSNNEKIGQNIT